jgi:hypothetical protein
MGEIFQPEKVHIGKIFRAWNSALRRNRVSANGLVGDIFAYSRNVRRHSSRKLFFH